MKTNFYIDGFNLYYGSLKGTTFRWLDLVQLCQKCFPDDEVHRIRYFTACVKPTPSNPHQAVRQQIYLRALRTLPPVEIHLGKFLIKSVTLPLSAPVPGEPDKAEVMRSEEKGSDVNLASYLLLDAFDDAFEKAVVVTNDSDLVTPVRIVRERFDKPVVVLFPCRRSQDPSYDLSRVGVATPSRLGIGRVPVPGGHARRERAVSQAPAVVTGTGSHCDPTPRTPGSSQRTTSSRSRSCRDLGVLTSTSGASA